MLAVNVLIQFSIFISCSLASLQTAFNPDYPFSYHVPPVLSLILNNKHINKSSVTFNSPYTEINRIKIGDTNYHKAIKCGAHFLNPSEGFILTDEIFEESRNMQRCVWGFVGSQFCTPSIECSKFSERNANAEDYCETNYLQMTDAGESFILHFCDKSKAPTIGIPYTSSNGVLDVVFRYSDLNSRPEFECKVKCVQYKVNWTTSELKTGNNKTLSAVRVEPSPPVLNTLPPTKLSPKCQCGISNTNLTTRSRYNDKLYHRRLNISNRSTNGRVLGGRETTVSQYPWMAGLVHNDKILPFCGASLINSRYVLTATHCLEDEDVEDFVVVLNEHDFRNQSETVGKTVTRKIVEMIPFTHYLESVFDGDIALLALDEPVNIQAHTLTPICLPKEKNNSYVDYDVVGAGWGTLTEDGEKSPVLLEVLLKVMSNAVCNDYHSSRPPAPLQVSERMMCSGYPEGGRDTCSGDSGGPLVAYDNNRYTQIGVTSWGFGCGNPLNPGVFARLTEFLYWIQMHTVDATYCT